MQRAFKMMNMFVPCTDKFVQCTYNVHTLNVQVQVFMCIKKKLLGLGLDFTTLGRLPGRPNHCASSVNVLLAIVMVCILWCYWRLVTYVWRRPSRPPRPRHDVAWLSLNMDLSQSQGRRRLGSRRRRHSDVAAHSGPFEEQPAT